VSPAASHPAGVAVGERLIGALAELPERWWDLRWRIAGDDCFQVLRAHHRARAAPARVVVAAVGGDRRVPDPRLAGRTDAGDGGLREPRVGLGRVEPAEVARWLDRRLPADY